MSESPDYVSPEVRAAVLKRDQYRCRRCGDQELTRLTVHHFVFRSQGGGHDEDNLVTLCWNPCHRLIHEGKVSVANKDGRWFFGSPTDWRHRIR